MRVMDVLFIGMLFIMTISATNSGFIVLEQELQSIKSVCRQNK